VHEMLVSGYRVDNDTEVHFFAPSIVQMPQDDRVMRSTTEWALGQWKLDDAPGPPLCVLTEVFSLVRHTVAVDLFLHNSQGGVCAHIAGCGIG